MLTGYVLGPMSAFISGFLSSLPDGIGRGDGFAAITLGL